MNGFRQQLDAVLRTAKGERVLDEALRLARDPVAKQRILRLRRKVGDAERPASARPPRD